MSWEAQLRHLAHHLGQRGRTILGITGIIMPLLEYTLTETLINLLPGDGASIMLMLPSALVILRSGQLIGLTHGLGSNDGISVGCGKLRLDRPK